MSAAIFVSLSGATLKGVPEGFRDVQTLQVAVSNFSHVLEAKSFEWEKHSIPEFISGIERVYDPKVPKTAQVIKVLKALIPD